MKRVIGSAFPELAEIGFTDSRVRHMLYYLGLKIGF